MMEKKRFIAAQTRVTRMLCALAMLFLGISHEPVVAYEPNVLSQYSEEYRLPDGSFADICLGNHDGSDKHQKAFQRCKACILASSILIPQAESGSWLIDLGASELVQTCDESLVKTHIKPHKKNPRAPPIIL